MFRIALYFILILLVILPNSVKADGGEHILRISYSKSEPSEELITILKHEIANNKTYKCELSHMISSAPITFSVIGKQLSEDEINIILAKYHEISLKQGKNVQNINNLMLGGAEIIVIDGEIAAQYYRFYPLNKMVINTSFEKAIKYLDEWESKLYGRDNIININNGVEKCRGILLSLWEKMEDSGKSLSFKGIIAGVLMQLGWLPSVDEIEKEGNLAKYGTIYLYNSEYQGRYLKLFFEKGGESNALGVLLYYYSAGKKSCDIYERDQENICIILRQLDDCKKQKITNYKCGLLQRIEEAYRKCGSNGKVGLCKENINGPFDGGITPYINSDSQYKNNDKRN